MGEHEGHSLGGRRSDKNQGHDSWFPGRPADAPEPKRAKKLPKGVQGQSLGGGKNRAKGKGKPDPKKDGCLVAAIALGGGIVAGVGGAAWAVTEGVRAIF